MVDRGRMNTVTMQAMIKYMERLGSESMEPMMNDGSLEALGIDGPTTAGCLPASNTRLIFTRACLVKQGTAGPKIDSSTRDCV